MKFENDKVQELLKKFDIDFYDVMKKYNNALLDKFRINFDDFEETKKSSMPLKYRYHSNGVNILFYFSTKNIDDKFNISINLNNEKFPVEHQIEYTSFIYDCLLYCMGITEEFRDSIERELECHKIKFESTKTIFNMAIYDFTLLYSEIQKIIINFNSYEFLFKLSQLFKSDAEALPKIQLNDIIEKFPLRVLKVSRFNIYLDKFFSSRCGKIICINILIPKTRPTKEYLKILKSIKLGIISAIYLGAKTKELKSVEYKELKTVDTLSIYFEDNRIETLVLNGLADKKNRENSFISMDRELVDVMELVI